MRVVWHFSIELKRSTLLDSFSHAENWLRRAAVSTSSSKMISGAMPKFWKKSYNWKRLKIEWLNKRNSLWLMSLSSANRWSYSSKRSRLCFCFNAIDISITKHTNNNEVNKLNISSKDFGVDKTFIIFQYSFHAKFL